MKVFISIFCIFFTLACSDSQRTFTNPIIDEVTPDPNILKHDGSYYMVFTQGDRIEVLKSRLLSNFRNAERREVYRVPPGRANLWSPEIHFIQGNFYIYFTMDDGVSDENHRMYVIKADDSNNPLGSWSSEVRLLPEEEIYAIDGTVLQYRDGNLYFIWTGFPTPPGSMNLYIARMENPMKVIAPRTLLRSPTMEWEMHGFPVNGGPSILQHQGRTFLVFSASSTFTPDYCLGIIGIDGGRDPLVISNWWNDMNHCVFTRNDEDSVFGPGHSTFVRSVDDSEVWMVYHAVDNINDLATNRRSRIQKIDWETNAPKFPRAAGIHRALQVPRGE